MNKTAFSTYHPLVNIIYFTLVISVTMTSMHPVCLLVSFIGSLLNYVSVSSKEEMKPALKFLLPILLFSVLMNSLFSHGGVKIILYLPSGNPLTVESMLYGFSAGIMLSSSLMWFMFLYKTVESEKILYLFSRISPTFSLLVSMIIRFIPELKRKYEETYQVQKLLFSGGRMGRIKLVVRCFISVFSQALENSLETADSMKSRGYGTGKRTSYRKYVFERRDKYVTAYILFSAFFAVCAGASGYISFRYYPNIKGVLFEPVTVVFYIVYFILCVLPVYLQRREEFEWKKSESKI